MISKVKPVVIDRYEKPNWFETWFDSPYYHLLYKNRDHHEAELFLDALIDFLKPEPHARILDVACGKGRHSIYLNKKGFDVTGYDLSVESIQHNKEFENETLDFYLHDMREIFRANYFDILLNLFSSFGYFENERDNIRCLVSNAIALKPGGIFVFDYFNVNKVKTKGNYHCVKQIDDVAFEIEKSITGNRIKKKITFSDCGKIFNFEEELLLIDRKGLEKYFTMAELEITGCFGNYRLEPFQEERSDRLILIAKKRKR